MIMTSILKWQVNPFLSYFLKSIFQLIVTNNVSADKVLFLAEKLKAIPMFSELFIYKINHNDLAALQILIQPLVYQVQYFFCV